jgi:hypothetical protein
VTTAAGDVRSAEPASFRDPATTVFYVGDRVLRGLEAGAAEDWRALAATTFFPRLVAEGKVVRTTEVDPSDVGVDPDRFTAVLEHERVPFVSYPHEWTFGMLRDAAELHLEVLLAALDDGFTMKDGYALNVQWRGREPVFIDVGSFEPATPGPWPGYRQFCRTLLYPLLLQAHLDVPYQRWLRGHLEGFEPSHMRRLLGGRHLLRRGVLRHVLLQAVMEQRVTTATETTKRELAKAGYDTQLTKAVATKLLALVRSLRSRRSASGWADYRSTCSYSDADTEAKRRFVGEVAEAQRPGLVWDLGCNDGAFARLVAPSAEVVVAVDGDDVVVDNLYRSLREGGPANVLPLVMDLVDPTPDRGWRGTERKAFTSRRRPDLVLGLALVHHLAIGSNVPLPSVLDWFASLGGALVIEFVDRDDPMVKRLLANKPAGMFDAYTRPAFAELLGARFTVERSETLPGGTRSLYLALPAA